MTANANPLSQLATVEANLTAAIDAAAGRLDQLGTNAVSAALARLQASAAAAQARLAATVSDLTATVAGVVESFTAATAGILGQLELNDQPAIPAQIAASIPPAVEPAPVKDLPPLVREVIATIACDVPSAAVTETTVEPSGIAPAHQEDGQTQVQTPVLPVAVVAANPPAASTKPTTTTSKPARKPRGKAGQPDGASAAGLFGNNGS